MFLNVGDDRLIHNDKIIGIFNIQYIKNTREYKSMVEKLSENKKYVDLSQEEAKSFILTDEKGYLVKLSTNTIVKRLI